MYPSRQCNPFPVRFDQGFLHVAEQTSSTREGKHHGPKLPKNLIAVFDTDPLLVGGRGGGGNNFFEDSCSVVGQAHHHVDYVQYPTKDHLTGGP